MTVGSLFSFNVSSETGLDLRHIPKALRDEEGNADTRSWAALFGDPTLARAPHELVFGTAATRFANYFGLSERQARDRMHAMHLHRCGAFGVTVGNSGQAARRDYEDKHIPEVRRDAGKRSGESRRGGLTDVSGATSARQIVEARQEESGEPSQMLPPVRF